MSKGYFTDKGNSDDEDEDERELMRLKALKARSVGLLKNLPTYGGLADNSTGGAVQRLQDPTFQSDGKEHGWFSATGDIF